MNPPAPLLASALVALGGGTGAVMRYQTGRLVTHLIGPNTVLPWGTLSVNIVGSLLMGLLAGFLARHAPPGPLGGEHWRLFLGVGLLGGFTTFSAFSLEMMLLIERGQPVHAAGYALVSVLAGLSGLFLGLVAVRIAG